MPRSDARSWASLWISERRIIVTMRRSALALLIASVLAGCATTHSTQNALEYPMVPSKKSAPAVRPHPVDLAPSETSAQSSTPTASEGGLSTYTVSASYTDLVSRLRDGYALPEVEDPAIDRQIKFYTSKPQYLDRTFARGERYFYYVVQELEARHMPMELALLPIIESGYNPYAYSRAKAAGIWQFITPTATRHQVRVNWWQDGRRDIMDSTRAALDYLGELHAMFNGDWLLAIAAYNCGEMAVMRSVQRNAAAGLPTDFWHVKLPAETRGYVPSLLAMAKLVRNPEAYGLDFEPIPNKPYFARVEVGGQIDLRVASAILNISDEEMHALNPAFNRWATDPEGPFHLLVPASSARAFAETVAGLTPDQRLPVEHHTLEPKETLAGIAKERNLPLAVVQQLNGSAKFEAKIGDDILLPSTTIIAPLRAGLVIEGETDKLGNPIKSSTTAQVRRHVLGHGETLASRPQQHRVEFESVAQRNGLKPKLSQKIVRTLVTQNDESRPLSADGHRSLAPMQNARDTKPSPHTSRTQSTDQREIRYQVKRGDTVAGISKKFSVTQSQLKAWNRIGNHLPVGEMVVVKVPVERDFGG